MSWDGLAILYDLNTLIAVSNTQYLLQNDLNKHSDGESAKISWFNE